MNLFTFKRDREIHRHPLVLTTILFDSVIPDTPLQKSKAITAKLTPKRIDIEETEQPFAETLTFHSLDATPELFGQTIELRIIK